MINCGLWISDCGFGTRASSVFRGQLLGTVAPRLGAFLSARVLSRLLSAFLLVCCSSKPAPASGPELKPALKIEGRVVPVSEWLRYRAMKIKPEEPQDEKQLFNLFVDEQIFLYLAARDGVEVDDEDVRESLAKMGLVAPRDKSADFLQSLREELRMQKWIKSNVSSAVRVTAEEAEEYYQRNSLEFMQPETVHVREILVKDQVSAEKLHRQLRKQPLPDFLRAARKYSQAASASDDGDLGVFQKGELPEAFENAIFRLRPGEISRPVKSDLGYHLFLLEERVRAHQQKFFEVKDQIFEDLLAQKESRAISAYLAETKKNLSIRTYPENLELK
ncbi:MAG TPA: peptidyl-prolyl cis-trans isomerase [Acidobacteriota bacterium]|jgi:parvulin-like peptidyl-prolyl isomerase